jgi:hypothetical protein
MADVSKYLPKLLGPHELTEDGGDAVTSRPTWNVIGATLEDDSANDRTNITMTADRAVVGVSALAIDWSLGGVFTKTLAAGANTFTFANATGGQCIIVRVTGATSTLTWPTVRWAGGAAPTQTSAGTDIYTFVHDGTSIYGSVVQAMA